MHHQLSHVGTHRRSNVDAYDCANGISIRVSHAQPDRRTVEVTHCGTHSVTDWLSNERPNGGTNSVSIRRTLCCTDHLTIKLPECRAHYSTVGSTVCDAHSAAVAQPNVGAVCESHCRANGRAHDEFPDADAHVVADSVAHFAAKRVTDVANSVAHFVAFGSAYAHPHQSANSKADTRTNNRVTDCEPNGTPLLGCA
jgi:hypothetical protein